MRYLSHARRLDLTVPFTKNCGRTKLRMHVVFNSTLADKVPPGRLAQLHEAAGKTGHRVRGFCEQQQSKLLMTGRARFREN